MSNTIDYFADYLDQNADLIDGLKRHQWNSFLRSLLDQVNSTGRPLTQRQEAAARDAIARYDARSVKSTPTNLGLDRIEAMFAKAYEAGLKAPMFRTLDLTIKTARRHENRLYVTDRKTDDYYGKIENGTYYPTKQSPASTLSTLKMICEDPEAAAKAYGLSTGAYGICNRELTDPTSVARGIGPICATKFGL